jgi:hypothetical protein
MKKWIKWTLGILGTLILAIAVLSAVGAYMQYQYKKNYIQAKHESKQTLLNYSKLKGIPGEILIAKNAASYKIVSKYFQPGTIIVLDSKNKIVDINNSTYGGSCYFDIAKDICNNFNFKNSKYNHKIVDSVLVKRLKSNTLFLTDYSWEENNKYDYTIIFCWAKWMKTSYSNEGAVEEINDCIKNNPKLKVLLVSVNSDCVSPWYPITKELPPAQF